MFGRRKHGGLVQVEEKDLKLIPSPPPISDLESSRNMNLQYIERLNEKITKLEELISKSQALLADYHTIRSAHLAALDILEKKSNLPAPDED